jgi:hypothetical protein
MGLLDEIERLINERGSAAILKERLLLFADKYAALEKALAVCESTAKETISDKKALELENLQLKEKIKALEKSLSEITQVNTYKMKWGCLVFEQDESLYCPSCFFGESKKTPTSRVNTYSRFCSVCKTTIPTG